MSRSVATLVGYAESDQEAQARIAAFRKRLRDLGWTEGRDIQVHSRWATGDQIASAAREVVALRPDAIFAATTPVVAALRRETSTTPIVFVSVSDPVGSRFVESLSRPGGNSTGFINVQASLGGKWLELLREIAPSVRRAAMIYNPDTAPYAANYLGPFEEAAVRLGMLAVGSPVRTDDEIAAVIGRLSDEPGGGLVSMTDGSMAVKRQLIIDLAARHRIPAIYPLRYMVAEGGLASYGVDTAPHYREAAVYVDRILKGASPAALPVQLPTKSRSRKSGVRLSGLAA